MRESRNAGTLLFGRTRQALLALFFARPRESYYLRQVAEIVGSGMGNIQRELNNLTYTGLVVRTRRGKQVFFEANIKSPIFKEIKAIVQKTSGVAETLGAALEDLENKIELAFLFGSIARSAASADSDIDLLVVGSIGFGDVVNAMQKAQSKLGREINPVVFSKKEFQERLAAKDHFVSGIIKGPKIPITGKINEF